MDDNELNHNSTPKNLNKTQENWLQNRNIMSEWTNYPTKLHGKETTYANSEWIDMKNRKRIEKETYTKHFCLVTRNLINPPKHEAKLQTYS